MLQRKKMIGKYFEQDKGFSINFFTKFCFKKERIGINFWHKNFWRKIANQVKNNVGEIFDMNLKKIRFVRNGNSQNVGTSVKKKKICSERFLNEGGNIKKKKKKV